MAKTIQFMVGDIPFSWPKCEVLSDKKVFEATYGDGEVNGTGKKTHFNLHKARAKNIHKALVIKMKELKAADKKEEQSAKEKS